MNTSTVFVCVCVQFIVKQSRRLTALVEFVAATFVVVITIVYELHAQQHSLSAPIAVIHYTNFVNDNGYCCCLRSNTFTERERESEKCRRNYAYTYVCSLALHSASVAVALPLSPSSFFLPGEQATFSNSKITHFLNYHSRAKQLHELILSFSLFLPYLLSQ